MVSAKTKRLTVFNKYIKWIVSQEIISTPSQFSVLPGHPQFRKVSSMGCLTKTRSNVPVNNISVISRRYPLICGRSTQQERDMWHSNPAKSHRKFCLWWSRQSFYYSRPRWTRLFFVVETNYSKRIHIHVEALITLRKYSLIGAFHGQIIIIWYIFASCNTNI